MLQSRLSLLVDPTVTLTLDPDAASRFLVRLNPVSAFAVLTAILPLTVVLTSVSPEVHAMTMLTILDVLSLVTPSILPGVDAVSMHVVVLPLARVLAPVDPLIGATAVNFVVMPVAIIFATIFPGVLATTVLPSFHVLALVLRAIRPLLDAETVLQIVLPVSLVLCTVCVRVSAVSVRLVVHPLPIVLVSVHVPESPLTVRLVEAPVTLVASAIGPDLHAMAVTVLALPLTGVFGTILELVLRPVFHRCIVGVTFLEFHAICGAGFVTVKSCGVLTHQLFALHDRRVGRQHGHVTPQLGAPGPGLQLHHDVHLVAEVLLLARRRVKLFHVLAGRIAGVALGRFETSLLSIGSQYPFLEKCRKLTRVSGGMSTFCLCSNRKSISG